MCFCFFFSNILTWQNKKLSTLYFPDCLEILLVHEIQTRGTRNLNSPVYIPPWGRRTVWKLSQGQSMPPPSSESARICYPIREIVDFFLSKVSLFFSIDKGMPSCSNSSFLRRSAVFLCLVQNSREQPKIVTYADKSSILRNQEHHIFTGIQGYIKERGWGKSRFFAHTS